LAFYYKTTMLFMWHAVIGGEYCNFPETRSANKKTC